MKITTEQAKKFVKKEWSENNSWHYYPPSENRVIEMVQKFAQEKVDEVLTNFLLYAYHNTQDTETFEHIEKLIEQFRNIKQ